jgi:hypothetical protein
MHLRLLPPICVQRHNHPAAGGQEFHEVGEGLGPRTNARDADDHSPDPPGSEIGFDFTFDDPDGGVGDIAIDRSGDVAVDATAGPAGLLP